MKSPFSIEESLRFGWKKTRTHSVLLFKIILTLFGLQVAYAIVGKVLAYTITGGLASLAIIIAELVVGVGFTLVTLKIAKGEHVEYTDVMPPPKLVWEYTIASVLAGLLIALGFILLIIPGFYFALRFSMMRFAVLEGAGIMGSLEKSGKLTEGVKWRLLGFLITIGLLNALGALLLGVGLLITVPVSMIAYAHVYQKLHAHHHPHHA